IFLNVGEAPPAQPDQNPPPLKPAFKKLEGQPDWLGKPERLVNVVVSDLDRDGDLDLLVLADDKPATAIVNDRLLRFHREETPNWQMYVNGGIVLDVNLDGAFDLFLIHPVSRSELLLGKLIEGEHRVAEGYSRQNISYTALIQAQAVDLDLDGFMD